MSSDRRNFTGAQKLAVLREHLIEKVPISESECIRPHIPLSLDGARRVIERFVDHYNTVRHPCRNYRNYVTPGDKLAGRERETFVNRDRKLAEARELRRWRRAGVEPTTTLVGS